MTADDIDEVISDLGKDSNSHTSWKSYIAKAYFAENIAWEDAVKAVVRSKSYIGEQS